MPNGGEHLWLVLHCPKCGSRRIHKRKGFHLIAKWRCRKHGHIFYSPKRKVWTYYGNDAPPKWAISYLEGKWGEGIHISPWTIIWVLIIGSLILGAFIRSGSCTAG